MTDVISTTDCPTPELLTKPYQNDGSVAFYWRDPACGLFFARATAHPDPENAPEESFEILQPTYHTRSATQSSVRQGMILLGPVYKSIIVGPSDPWTGVELFRSDRLSLEPAKVSPEVLRAIQEAIFND